MSNAAKFRKKAAEFEQLKQIDRAIASYVKAIEESEAAGEDIDVALFNKVGDLALRQGRVPDAITYYERAVEHYATSGLFNNAIALCNKILRNAPGRANVYFTLGRICARKGLRGDATRNFLEYATRMQQEGRVDEGMRALAEVADLMPELTEVQRLVEEHAARAGITLPRRRTPARAAAAVESEAPAPGREQKSADLVFLDIDYGAPRRTPLANNFRVPTPVAAPAVPTPADVPVILPFITDDPDIPTPPLVARTHAARPEADTPAAALPDNTPPEAAAPDLASQTVAHISADAPPVQPLAGLDPTLEVEGTDVPVLDGLTSHELTPADAGEDLVVAAPLDLTSHTSDPEAVVPILDELVVEDFQDGPTEDVVSATFGVTLPDVEGAPPLVVDPTPLPVDALIEPEAVRPSDGLEPVDAPPALDDLDLLAIEPLEMEPVPELDAAIAAGAELVALAEDAERTAEAMQAVRPTPRGTPVVALDGLLDTVEETVVPFAPPYRIDPHDFILPGELPPLILEDAFVARGLAADGVAAGERASAAAGEGTIPTDADNRSDAQHLELDVIPEPAPSVISQVAQRAVEAEVAAALAEAARDIAQEDAAEDAAEHGAEDTAAVTPEAAPGGASADASADASAAAPADAHALAAADAPVPSAESAPVAEIGPEAEPEAPVRPVSATPALPIAAVAAEAQSVAAARRDSLRSAVARMPQNWLLRRRLAEALLEAGEREAALAELETAQTGLADAHEFTAAAEIADELVHVCPDRVPYHQKRVELAVRTGDQQRLRFAYLDLADALVRLGEESRARAVYARVLEIDPYDDRARAALGAAAPPPPAPAPTRPDDQFVDLADWLRDDDEPKPTRMRMREPVISGDEQADFEALLQHFKEGVARSLGEDDFESHYDLGVAFKEMGLLEDAIAEFQKALRSRTHRLPAYEALGQCFVEQGRHQVAATILSRALHEPGLNDDQRVGVLYLLAYSCEALQRWDEARSYYQRVYATDIQFRDVAARLAAVEQASR